MSDFGGRSFAYGLGQGAAMGCAMYALPPLILLAIPLVIGTLPVWLPIYLLSKLMDAVGIGGTQESFQEVRPKDTVSGQKMDFDLDKYQSALKDYDFNMTDT